MQAKAKSRGTILLLVAALGAGGLAAGQVLAKDGQEHRAAPDAETLAARQDKMTQRLASKLAIDDATAANVAEVLQQHHAVRRAAMEERRASGAGRPSRDEMQALRAAGQAELDADLATYLNADQIRHVHSLVGKRKGGGRDRQDRHDRQDRGQPEQDGGDNSAF